MTVESIKQKVLHGGECTVEEALWIVTESNCDDACKAAHEITKSRASQAFDMCSIMNVKSGHCSENCKWCAQSVHYQTGITMHGIADKDDCLQAARHNERQGVNRFALVASGRRPGKGEVKRLCDNLAFMRRNSDIHLCVSLGLADEEDMRNLKECGVSRYHCNMETAPSFFPSLCSTHTQQEKTATLEAARRAGLEVCSGGIIGMGETMEQRVEFSFFLKKLQVDSIPLNLLQPIAGTPLADVEKLSAEEILRTIAMFRFVHPQAFLRFAGGRAQMSEETVHRALYTGINSAIVGDLLTTLGSKVEDDKKMIQDAGYRI